MKCQLCPRVCGADRTADETGYCGADASLRVARAALHFWEEPPISGTRGSGTVFFSNCSLRCAYCQNVTISTGQVGKAISVNRLAEIFLELQEQGAHNINLVTPTHYVEAIMAALDLAHSATPALHIPIVYNTSGYERVQTIQRLADYVDIYLTDYKYASPELATRYSSAPDYPNVALVALAAMVQAQGEYRLNAEGLLEAGVIVRHLLLPGHLDDSLEALEAVFATVGNKVCYALMNQFTALPTAPAELQQRVREADYSKLIDFALDLGITNSFMQEGETAEESFIPPFDLQGV